MQPVLHLRANVIFFRPILVDIVAIIVIAVIYISVAIVIIVIIIVIVIIIIIIAVISVVVVVIIVIVVIALVVANKIIFASVYVFLRRRAIFVAYGSVGLVFAKRRKPVLFRH
ncbi:MAG: hypothetical protein LBJ64_04850 [Deltaproteobacteria bacterium]|nr:hypothetical protein [Deltaproteobacteria bacterium]